MICFSLCFCFNCTPKYRTLHRVASYGGDESRIMPEFIIPGTWLDSALRLSDWTPRFPFLYDSFSLRKMDSMVLLCEKTAIELYGPRDSIKGKCKVYRKDHEPAPGDYEAKFSIPNDSLPDAFELLDMFCGRLDYRFDTGYFMMRCNNPIPKIDWYWSHRNGISPLIYKYYEFFGGEFAGFKLVPTDFDMGLKYKNTEYRKAAMLSKLWEIRGNLERLTEMQADDRTVDSCMRIVIYEQPFSSLYDDEYFDTTMYVK